MALVLYPYVYMLARSAFIAQGRSMMDAAQILGLNTTQAFFRIALPIARPAIVAGTALALMETLADFGAVSVFNYDTFTTAVYKSWYGLFNLTVAAQLASLLLLFVGLALMAEQVSRGQAKYKFEQRSKEQSCYQLKGARAYLAFGYCFLIVSCAFIIPLGQLVSWSLLATDASFDQRYFGLLRHTLGLGAIAAMITVAVALLLAYGKRLPGSQLSRFCLNLTVHISTLGYALPGSVLAVGIMLGFTLLDQSLVSKWQALMGKQSAPLLVGSLFALVMAYCIRFLAVAFAPVESALERIKDSIVESAQSLGAKHWQIIHRVYLPMLRPGLLTAIILVFVDVMKEMPATLIMRPFAWDTLAVRIYEMTSEGQWEQAALPAVTLVLIGLLPVILLIKRSA